MKRVIDFIGACLGLILFSPLFLVLAVLIRVKLGSPVLFRQLRGGLKGRPFEIIKFRSMTDQRDVSGNLLPDGERLTRFSRFLRSTSLDEIPELYNILKGDISFIGPRPLLAEYLDLYTPEQGRRHEVKPGITGWAQVNGRNALTWEERFQLDTWYVDHQSLRLDLKILVMTIGSVIVRKNISAANHDSMPKFTGS
jgi:sugar transferase EpsL